MERSKIALAGVSLLLVLSAVLNIIQYTLAQDNATDIVGAFKCGDRDAEHLVFTQDNHYLFYRQLEPPLDWGRYAPVNEDGGIYALTSHTGATSEVLVQGDIVYCWQADGILPYTRFSDIPVYINVEPPYENND